MILALLTAATVVFAEVLAFSSVDTVVSKVLEWIPFLVNMVLVFLSADAVAFTITPLGFTIVLAFLSADLEALPGLPRCLGNRLPVPTPSHACAGECKLACCWLCFALTISPLR